MAAQSTKPAKTTTNSHKPYNRKYNRKKVVQMAMNGIQPATIARDQAVACSTITRYLASIGLKSEDLEQYKRHRPDLKALIGMKGEEKMLEIIPTIDASQLRASEKNGALMALNAIVGTRHQEERLERDLSTSNTASIHADVALLKGVKGGS